MVDFDRFGALSDDLRNKISSMQKKIDQKLASLPNGEEKKKLLREFDSELQESQRLLREMQLEVDSDVNSPSSYRQQQNSQIREFRGKVDQLKLHSSKLRASEQPRNATYSNNNPFFEEDPQQTPNRSRLLEGRAVLERTSDSLARSMAIGAESERIGTDVLGELHTQREQLENTRYRLEDTNTDLARSRKIIRSMGRRIVTNKLFLFVIIFLEVGILGGLVYWKFFSHK